MPIFCSVPRPVLARAPHAAPRRAVVAQVASHPMDPSINLADFKQHENDVGSTELQIAQLTARVRLLTEHLKANRKDYACERGLKGILGQRTRLLKYLYKKDQQSFARCVRDLKIRNPIKSVVLKK